MNPHPYAGEHDLREMQALLTDVRPRKYFCDHPSATDLHELLLIAGIRNSTALWRGEDGELLAYALVDVRYRNIYFDIRPGSEGHSHPTSSLGVKRAFVNVTREV